MRFGFKSGGIGLAVFLGVCAWTTAGSAQQPKTVWDGVYSEAQATRIAPFYSQKCSRCHDEEMTGKDGPPIGGAVSFHTDVWFIACS